MSSEPGPSTPETDPVVGPHLPPLSDVLDQCRGRLYRRLSELISLEQLCRQAGDWVTTRTEALIDVDDYRLPVVSLCIGDPARPAAACCLPVVSTASNASALKCCWRGWSR